MYGIYGEYIGNMYVVEYIREYVGEYILTGAGEGLCVPPPPPN